MGRKKRTDAKTGAGAADAHAATEAAEVAKRNFNLNVLRKHIPAIASIASSASFVVLYVHSDDAGSWTKTGIEGPLFLFAIDPAWAQTAAGRALTAIAPDKAPPAHASHGFIILNRNGLENFVVYISAADDIEITPQFILYRPDMPPAAAAQEAVLSTADSDEHDAGTTFAIWVFEEEERLRIGQDIEQLHALASNVTAQTNSRSEPSQEPGSAPVQTLLDLLFQSVAQPQSAAA